MQAVSMYPGIEDHVKLLLHLTQIRYIEVEMDMRDLMLEWDSQFGSR